MSQRRFGTLSELHDELRRRVGERHIHYKFGNPDRPTVMFVTYFPSHFDDINELEPGMAPEEYEQVCEVRNRDRIFNNYGLFQSYLRFLFLPSGITSGHWRIPSEQWLDVAYETCACKTEEPRDDIPRIVRENYADLLEEETRLVDPQVIVTAGEIATQTVADRLLGNAAPRVESITESRYWNPDLYDTDPEMIPTVHWSAPNHNPEFREPFQDSVARARDRLRPYFVDDES